VRHRWINDGSGATPYRLSLVSRNSGLDGRLIFDGSGAGISTTSLVGGQGRQVAIYAGNAAAGRGLQVTNSSNALAGIVPGLTLTLNGIGSTSVSVNQDTQQDIRCGAGVVDAYNKVVGNIADVTDI